MKTYWNNGNNFPDKIGLYERLNSIGNIVFSWWDGTNWWWWAGYPEFISSQQNFLWRKPEIK